MDAVAQEERVLVVERKRGRTSKKWIPAFAGMTMEEIATHSTVLRAGFLAMTRGEGDFRLQISDFKLAGGSEG